MRVNTNQERKSKLQRESTKKNKKKKCKSRQKIIHRTDGCNGGGISEKIRSKTINNNKTIKGHKELIDYITKRERR